MGINALGYFFTEKLVSETRVSTITGRGFHMQLECSCLNCALRDTKVLDSLLDLTISTKTRLLRSFVQSIETQDSKN